MTGPVKAQPPEQQASDSLTILNQWTRSFSAMFVSTCTQKAKSRRKMKNKLY
jgi:hypothetical protein